MDELNGIEAITEAVENTVEYLIFKVAVNESSAFTLYLDQDSMHSYGVGIVSEQLLSAREDVDTNPHGIFLILGRFDLVSTDEPFDSRALLSAIKNLLVHYCIEWSKVKFLRVGRVHSKWLMEAVVNAVSEIESNRGKLFNKKYQFEDNVLRVFQIRGQCPDVDVHPVQTSHPGHCADRSQRYPV